MGSMKRLALLFTGSAALLCAADLSSVHTVYVLKMTKGLDQFLANRLTTGHVFQIVTDPKLADAVFTDQLGEAFQARLEQFSPTPEEEKPEPPPKKDDDEDAGKPKGFGKIDEDPMAMVDAISKGGGGTRISSFSQSKGTVFLVDSKSRQVVWSMFTPPKPATSRNLDSTASDIVSRLKKDLKGK
jgi:hypothetical protein